MGNTLSFTVANQNDVNTTNDDDVNMGDLSGNVIKVNIPYYFVNGYRPTSSCVIPLDQGDNLASDTSRGQNRCCLIVVIGCVLFVVLVWMVVFFFPIVKT